jgi:hypothetical protein
MSSTLYLNGLMQPQPENEAAARIQLIGAFVWRSGARILLHKEALLPCATGKELNRIRENRLYVWQCRLMNVPHMPPELYRPAFSISYEFPEQHWRYTEQDGRI